MHKASRCSGKSSESETLWEILWYEASGGCGIGLSMREMVVNDYLSLGSGENDLNIVKMCLSNVSAEIHDMHMTKYFIF